MRIPTRRALGPDSGRSDRELVDAILAGDGRACEEFIDRFCRLIYYSIRKIGVSREEEEDLFQESIRHLWEDDCQRLRQWQGSGLGKLSSFLRVVVVRLGLDYCRQRTVLRTVYLSSDQDTALALCQQSVERGPEALAIDAEQRRVVRSAMRRLSPRDAEIIGRRYHRQQSYRDIADGLGMTVNTVGVALGRAERRLQKILIEQHSGLFE